MRRKRGECAWCGEHHALNVDVCDSCIEEEESGQREHEEYQKWLDQSSRGVHP